jgi:hypothetical protein
MTEADVLEVIEWLTSGRVLAINHTHSESCGRDAADRRTKCGYSQGELERSKVNNQDLAKRFIEIREKKEG